MYDDEHVDWGERSSLLIIEWEIWPPRGEKHGHEEGHHFPERGNVTVSPATARPQNAT